MSLDLVRHKGVYSPDRIIDWTRRLLAKKNVRWSDQLRMPCRILSSNVTRREYFRYSECERYDVAEAIAQSISIPLFFRPYVSGDQLYVDGGMLSNRPLWLFDDSELTTVGLRFGSPDSDFAGAKQNSNVIAYLAGLISTMVEAHDGVRRGVPPSAIEVPINVGKVRATQFDLEPEQVDLLFQRGYEAVAGNDWTALPKPVRLFYHDEHAAELLEKTSSSLHKLFASVEDSEPRQREFESYDVTYWIRSDGSGYQEYRFALVNHGPHTISMMMFETNYGYEVDFSLRDLNIEAHAGGAGYEAVWLPYRNTRVSKGFLIALLPPILAGDRRELVVRHNLPDGFRDYLRAGKDEVGFSQLHECGVRRATMTLHVDATLPEPRIVDDVGKRPSRVEANGHKIRWEFEEASPPSLEFSARFEAR